MFAISFQINYLNNLNHLNKTGEIKPKKFSIQEKILNNNWIVIIKLISIGVTTILHNILNGQNIFLQVLITHFSGLQATSKTF